MLREISKQTKQAACTAAGFGIGYGVVPAAAGYYAAQQAPYWFLREHAKAAAYNAAMQFAPHIAAGVSIGLPIALTSAYYIGSGLFQVAKYAVQKPAAPVAEQEALECPLANVAAAA